MRRFRGRRKSAKSIAVVTMRRESADDAFFYGGRHLVERAEFTANARRITTSATLRFDGLQVRKLGIFDSC